MAIGVLTLAVTAASAIYQHRQGVKAQKAQEQQNSISNAAGKYNNIIARRQAAREARIKRNRLQASAANTGTTGSSGEFGAGAAIGSNFGASVSIQETQQNAARGLSAARQKEADAQTSINNIRNWTQVGRDVIGVWEDIQDSAAG